MYESGSERGELSSDRLSDPHRPPSDTGSLSPPWDRERRIILSPPGIKICLAAVCMHKWRYYTGLHCLYLRFFSLKIRNAFFKAACAIALKMGF